MKFLKEFKEFINRGNVVDMAVGIVIGGAFVGIVNSLVNDIIMPLFGFVLGRFDFSNLKFVLIKATEESAAVAVTYGVFIQKTVDFLIMSAAVFIIIRKLNKLKEKKSKEKEVAVQKDIELLTEIKDLLKEAVNEQGNKQ